MKTAARLENLPSYPFARWGVEVARASQSGLDVIRLDIGNPDLPPPPAVIDALCRTARRPDSHGYMGSRGLPVLRQAIQAYYQRRFGVELDPENEVLPLIGSKEGIVNLALAVLDPGDLVLVPDPGYAPYVRGAALAGAEVVTMPLRQENAFLPDLDAIPPEIADRVAMMWLNYPNNPTGATADLDFLAQAVSFCHQHDILFCYDAPYCDVCYGDYRAPSILQVPGARDVAIEFNSLSKSWNMAGWRIGMAVGHADALAALARIKSNVDSSFMQPVQEAAVTALCTEPEWIVERNAIYQERLTLMGDTLREIGLAVVNPRATLYFWAPVPAGYDAEGFALDLLHRTGVSVAPGSFFGPAGDHFVRLSVTAPTEQVREAMGRLRTFLG